MAKQIKTPGVYIVEKNAFPNSVVQVATAVPAFIGFTERATDGKNSLHMVPKRITSLSEYHNFFGAMAWPQYEIVPEDTPSELETGDPPEPDPLPRAIYQTGAEKFELRQTTPGFCLYGAMRMFFFNGGDACHIVSVGSYEGDNPFDPTGPAKDAFLAAIELLKKEQEPTMLVIPETTRLRIADAFEVQQKMLTHCGAEMKNRFAILDIHHGFRPLDDPQFEPVSGFRNGIGINNLDFGAAYYPWLNSTVFQSRDFSFEAIAPESRNLLADQLSAGIEDQSVLEEINNLRPLLMPLVDLEPPSKLAEEDEASEEDKPSPSPDPAPTPVPTPETIDKTLRAISPLYVDVMNTITAHQNTMSPGAAMAGLYTAIDNSRGVWKAPANVSVGPVTAPAVNVSHGEQENLNVSTTGKSINAIRPFVGEGTLVWGARTLDGNSLDWRYINVRRTMIMIEESIRLACRAYVFEPNTANTWVTMKSMITNFLTNVWKAGGLAGAVPEDAFSVQLGLGETMTPEDILEGLLRVTVLVAVARPAEFIEITFQQQMQKS